jgi:hypothetical protein
MSKRNQTSKKPFRAHFLISASNKIQIAEKKLKENVGSSVIQKKKDAKPVDFSMFCSKNIINPVNTFINIKNNCSESRKIKNNSPPKLETFHKLAKLYQIEMPKINDEKIRLSKEKFQRTFRLKRIFLKSMENKKVKIIYRSKIKF